MRSLIWVATVYLATAYGHGITSGRVHPHECSISLALDHPWPSFVCTVLGALVVLLIHHHETSHVRHAGVAMGLGITLVSLWRTSCHPWLHNAATVFTFVSALVYIIQRTWASQPHVVLFTVACAVACSLFHASENTFAFTVAELGIVAGSLLCIGVSRETR